MRFHKLISVLFVLAVVVCGNAPSAWSQTADTGALTGTLVDQAQAAVQGVEVTLTNEGTGAARTVISDANGFYRAPLLAPGAYRLDAKKAGFKVATRSGVHIVVTETATLNIQLAVGEVTEKVTVTANTELVQTESSALGRTTSEDFIVSLPLSTRNYTQILALSTGVAVELPNSGEVGTNSQNVSANGARTTYNNFLFNGVDANNISENSAVGFAGEVGLAIPAPDTIQEFKAQTALYDASGGRGAGANVDVVSKSGTNSFHGTLWEFFRNDKLNANEFFLNRASQPRPVLKQNQFGFTLGGPIRKDKTFFFGSYQGTRQRNGVSSLGFRTASLPPLTNDRSALAIATIFNGQRGLFQNIFGGVGPAIDKNAPNGSGGDTNPYNINPVALALLNFKFPNGAFAIPTPNGPNGQFSFSSPVKFREDQFTVNLDQAFSSRNQFSGRFFYARAPEEAPFFRHNLPGWGLNKTDQNLMTVLSDTHTFSKIVNIARVAYIRFHGDQNQPEPIKNSDVGITSPGGLAGIPAMFIGGFSIGPDLFLAESTNSFIAQDTVGFVIGKHSFRLGVEVKHDQKNQYPHFADRGDLVFLSFPDFLLGLSGPQNGTGLFSNVFGTVLLTGPLDKAERFGNFAGFVQDDYKVSPRLTLNLGLRYEFFGPPSDIRGRLANFDPSLADPVPPAGGTLSGIVLASNYRGPLPAGVTQTKETNLWEKNFKDFAPRVGFALRLRDKPGLVLRGGYGIYYSKLTGQVSLQTISDIPFALSTLRFGASNAAATFQQPVNPAVPPLSSFPIFVPRTGSASDPTIPNSNINVGAVSRALRTPYLQQYNLNLQYEFARDFLWEIGYVGSKGTHLGGAPGFNQPQIATPQNPVHGVITTTTVGNALQRAPFVGASSGSFLVASPFSSNYNSLQTSVTKRLSHGLDFLASYTWSKSLDVVSGGSSEFDIGSSTNDQTNLRNAYGPSDFDRTHRFVLSFVYQPPALQSGPRALQVLLSKWQFSGVTVFQSGIPITVTDSLAGTAYGTLPLASRAECTGQNPASSGSVASRLDGYFNPAAFTAAPIIGDPEPTQTGLRRVATGFGNCGKGFLRGPSQRNLDLGIQRSFRIIKETDLLFRAEIFNFTNTPNFGQPSAELSNGPAIFGHITNTVSNPRIIQFALKYNF